MIKTLQKKFVVTAMIAITLLLLFLLGALNIGNAVITERQGRLRLHLISERESQASELQDASTQTSEIPDSSTQSPDPQKPVEEREKGSIQQGKNEEDTYMASNFFTVRFDTEGEEAYTDVSRTSSISEEEAVDLAEQLCNQGKQEGKSGKYLYQVGQWGETKGKLVVCLDVSAETLSCIRVMLLSLGIGVLCWGIMLVLVILLSRRAIRPIAENMERQKQFVTNAGHEIKTPLAIIQSNTEAMELYAGENKWSRNIKEQTLRLNELMKNLLSLARMEEGTAGSRAVEFELSELLEREVQTFEQPVAAKEIRLELAIDAGLRLKADKGQIAQLISILLDNALKYTPQEGEIRITLKRREKRICLTAENSCEQLPDVPPERLFERFYRGDKARTQSSGGYGIGLSVAKAVVEANGGKICAEYDQSSHIRFVILF